MQPREMKKVSEFIDGLILEFENWEIMKPAGTFTFRCEVNRITPSTLKGIVFSQPGTESFRMTMGSYGGMTLAAIITLNIPNSPDLHIIMNNARSIIPERSFSSLRNCKSKQYFLSNTSSKQYSVFIKDMKDFGQEFLLKLDDYISETFGENKIAYLKYVLYNFGQDTPVEMLDDMLSIFRLDCVETMVVHWAWDFEISDCLAYFRTEDLKEMEHRLSRKFVVGLLGGVFNVYDDRNLDNGDYQMNQQKWYSELFKDQHRGSYRKFSKPIIAMQLFNPTETAFGFVPRIRKPVEWKRHLKELNDIAMVIENVRKQVCKSRHEVIVSMQVCNVEEVWDIFSQVKQDICIPLLKKILNGIPLVRVKQHLETNLLPSVNTLRNMIRCRQRALAKGEREKFGPEEYHTALGCESVICFGLYGTWSLDTIQHASWVRNSLNIQKSDFKECNYTETGQSIFSEYFRTTCAPLRRKEVWFSPNYDKIDGDVQAVAQRYKLTDSIINDIVDLDRAVRNSQIEEIPTGEQETAIQKACEGLVNCLLKTLLNWTRKRKLTYHQRGILRRIDAIHKNSYLSPMLHVNSKYVSQRVFQSDEFGKLAVFAWVVDCYKFVLRNSEALMACMETCFEEAVEDLMMTQEHFLVIPTRRFSLVCLPGFGTRRHPTWEWADDLKQKIIHLHCSAPSDVRRNATEMQGMFYQMWNAQKNNA